MLISGEAAVDLRRSYGCADCRFFGFGLPNSGCVIFVEIFRAGIQSIDKGQMEAARSLGLTYTQAMRYVILPQAFCADLLPPLASEFITLLKEPAHCFPSLAWQSWLYVQSTITDPILSMKSRFIQLR